MTTNLQLVYTGPYLPPDNSTLSGQLSQWEIDICNDPKLSGNPFFGYSYRGCRHNGSVAPGAVEIFNINAMIHIQAPTCNIDPGSVTKSVTLPVVNTQQLTGQGSTAGKTPFSLLLTQCPEGLRRLHHAG